LGGETGLVRTHVLERESRAGWLQSQQELSGRGRLGKASTGKKRAEQ
jgi:hypothetical protein